MNASGKPEDSDERYGIITILLHISLNQIRQVVNEIIEVQASRIVLEIGRDLPLARRSVVAECNAEPRKNERAREEPS